MPTAEQTRLAIVDHALWSLTVEPQIHYDQSFGVRFGALWHPRQVPMWTDCSAIWTMFYNWAGAPDPNGRGYDGNGYTGTMVQHLRTIDIRSAQLGDLIIYGYGMGKHVAGIVGDAGSIDPWLVSHGQERGPIKIRQSVEARAQGGVWKCYSGGIGTTAPTPPPKPKVKRKVNAIVTDPIDSQTYEFDLRDNTTIGIKNIKEVPWSTVAGFDQQKYGIPISLDADARPDGTLDLSVKTDKGVMIRCGKPHGKATFDPWWT